jgi:hypothetical protein
VLKDIKFIQDMKLPLLHLPGLGTTQTINEKKGKELPER